MNFNPVIENLKVYEPGKPIETVVKEYGLEPGDIIKLASNENPYGCSEKVIEAVSKSSYLMYRYPDDSMDEAKGGLAKKYSVAKENLIIGAGSDQVIELACRAVLESGSKVLQSEITFAMYQIYSSQCGATVIKSPGISHDLEKMHTLYIEHKPKIIFICAPNNPTGDSLDSEDIDNFISLIDRDTLVILDGAYQEYASYKDSSKSINPSTLIKKYPNLLYLGTFSKAYGLGGMRIGYGIADGDIIKALYKLRPPFNVTTLSLIAASEALKDEVFVKTTIKNCFEEMRKYEEFAEDFKIEFIKSYTNFITLKFPTSIDSTVFSNELLRMGIIVRDLKGYGLNAIRVTIGKPNENIRFFKNAGQLIERMR